MSKNEMERSKCFIAGLNIVKTDCLLSADDFNSRYVCFVSKLTFANDRFQVPQSFKPSLVRQLLPPRTMAAWRPH